jgi:glycosyltransferase involved in cell wall biosynthesis
MHKFVIVIPSYNNHPWAQQNIVSALTQNHPNFRIIFTDDCSSDKTFDITKENCAKHPNVKADLIQNTKRNGAMCNLYNMISHCASDEIVVTLDGDDWLPHPDVLIRLEKEYDKGFWMTYGQCLSVSNRRPGPSRPLPNDIIAYNNFRKYDWCTSHLRSFYAGLFQKINVRDLKDNNENFYQMAWDLCMMFPMLEMSGARSSYINDVLYMYNDLTPFNDFKVNLALQQQLDQEIRTRPPYQLLGRTQW